MRLLLVRAGALGDLVLLRPAIAAARAHGHAVTLLAPSGPAAAVRGGGAADVSEVLPWESAAFAPLFADGASPSAEAAERLRAHDAAVVYSRDAAFAARLRALIPRLAACDPAPPSGGPHASAWLASALSALGIPPGPAVLPPLAGGERHAAADEIAAALPARFTAIHPGSGSRRKNWPAERFAEVARVVACGETMEGASVAEVRRALDDVRAR